MQYWLDSLAYGNKKISVIDSFWLDNSLKITSDEQLGLVKRLYFEQLPMDKRPQRIVKQMMLQEQNSNYELAYKTGWGTTPTGKEIGWVVGWIEENRHPYFFVLNLEGEKGMNMPEVRNQLLDELLRHLGFKEGKK
jgi:beta-lactamase class D